MTVGREAGDRPAANKRDLSSRFTSAAASIALTSLVLMRVRTHGGIRAVQQQVVPICASDR